MQEKQPLLTLDRYAQILNGWLERRNGYSGKLVFTREREGNIFKLERQRDKGREVT